MLYPKKIQRKRINQINGTIILLISMIVFAFVNLIINQNIMYAFLAIICISAMKTLLESLVFAKGNIGEAILRTFNI